MGICSSTPKLPDLDSLGIKPPALYNQAAEGNTVEVDELIKAAGPGVWRGGGVLCPLYSLTRYRESAIAEFTPLMIATKGDHTAAVEAIVAADPDRDHIRMADVR